MSNSIFDWPASLKRFVRFTSAKAEEVNDALDSLSAGLDVVEADIRRSLKLPVGTGEQTLALTPAQRATLLLGFDANGNVTAIAGGGRWRDDWATGTEYAISDYFRDPVSKNIYVAMAPHAATTIAADLTSGKIRLAINLVDVETAKTQAQDAALQAGVQAGIATQKAVDAAQSYTDANSRASDAEDARDAAVVAQNGAEAALDSFNDIYLGEKSSDPTTDNDGNPLIVGALYYRTGDGMRVWTGLLWDAAYIASTGVLLKSGGYMEGAIGWAPRASVASASTVDLGAINTNLVTVTGNATISSFGSVTAGAFRKALFSGTPTLTHNATSLILPGGANIAVAAGDVAEFESLGSGNWRCVSYLRASGQAVASSLLTTYQDIAVNTSAVAFGRYRLTASLDLELPPAPTDGQWVDLVNHSGTTTSRVLRNGNNINGLAQDMTIDALWVPLRVTFRTGYGWFVS